MAALSVCITYVAEGHNGALKSSQAFPVGLRFSNALGSVRWYACATVFPHALSFYYPYPTAIGIYKTVLIALALALLTTVLIRCRQDRPQLGVAVLCFLLLAGPVLGFVQIGAHSHANRYTYLPMLPLLAVLVYTFPWRGTNQGVRSAVFALVGALLVTQLFVARKALEAWRSSETLFENALRFCPENLVARVDLSSYLISMRRYKEALQQIDIALKLHPHSVALLHNKATAFACDGNVGAASVAYRQALQEDPLSFLTLIEVARLHLESNDPGVHSAVQAKGFAQRAVVLQPSSPDAWELLARCYYACGEANRVDRTLVLAREALARSRK